MNIEERANIAVDRWRIIAALAASIGVTVCLFDGEFLSALILIPMNILMYYGGLYVIVKYLTLTTPYGEAVQAFQAKKVQEINARLADGMLEAGSPELEALMKEAGLNPLSVVESFGPVFGRMGDVELYEWIDAKQGSAGETKRYTYVKQAHFDADGTAIVPNENNLFIVVDGFLYEHIVSDEPEAR